MIERLFVCDFQKKLKQINLLFFPFIIEIDEENALDSKIMQPSPHDKWLKPLLVFH